MTKKEIMIKAHKMTKEIKNEYPEVDYKFQLGLCLAYLQEGGNEMVELKGSVKQIAWATEIRELVLELAENSVKLAEKWCSEKRSMMRERKLKKAVTILEKIKNEESAKFFIENFRIVLEEKKFLIKNDLVEGSYLDNKFLLMKYDDCLCDLDYLQK